MSTSPGLRGRRTTRATIVTATIVASLLTSTRVVGLDPGDSAAAPATTTTAATASAFSTTTTTAVSTTTTQIAPETAPTRPFLPATRSIPCSTDLGMCDEEPTAPDAVPACTGPLEDVPTGETDIVAAGGDAPAGAVRIRVEVERGLAVDRGCFAAAVLDTLNDPRGWGVDFVLVDEDDYDFRLVLASPATTDSLCHPSKTNGIYSCRNGSRVVINLMRWETGTDDYTGDLTTYRRYLLNHEVGHFLGKRHVQCPGPGEPAPVMMQQTKGLGQCVVNGWPTDYEP